VRHSLFVGLPILLLTLAGCQTASDHAREVERAKAQQSANLTVGTVQREIFTGMAAPEVIRVLGSPNIVTKTKNGETWMYDRFSTDSVYSRSEGGISFLALGGTLVGVGLAGGAVSPSYSQDSGATSTSQRTLTVIIELSNGKVERFDYHATRF
tara:strand:- start:620 stop:1081 length:462 start_codon:yes stop_codon:yes gene_type:complete